jgi:hypothetical protein
MWCGVYVLYDVCVVSINNGIVELDAALVASKDKDKDSKDKVHFSMWCVIRLVMTACLYRRQHIIVHA